MSTNNKQMDDEFLTEDTKEDDLFDDLDNAAEEELLHFSEEDDFLVADTQDDQIEYVDEEGNPIELQEGEQVEVFESEDVIELGTQINTSDFLSQSETEENDKPDTNDLNNSGQLYNDRSELDDSMKTNPSNTFDEAEEDDDEDNEEEQRNRFRTERRNIVTINSSKRSARDIPDSLDSVVLEEEELKAAEFMNRQKDRKRGNWRGHRRGVIPGIQRLSNNKPPLLSVMPQPQSRPKEQIGVVHGATRLPPPQNFQQQDITINSILENQDLSNLSNNAPSTPLTPRKILINPHFRGPRPSPPQQTSSQQIRSYERPHVVEVPPQVDAGHASFTPSQISPPNYDLGYDQDPNYGRYDDPGCDYRQHAPPSCQPPQPPQFPSHPEHYHHPDHHQTHHPFHHPNYNDHVSPPHPRLPHPPPQRPQHPSGLHFPPDHQDTWHHSPSHQLPIHHSSLPPPSGHHMPNPPHQTPYEHQFRGPPPLPPHHHQEPPFGHHPAPPQPRFQNPHHFSNAQQFQAPPHPQHHFRPQHPTMPHNADFNYQPRPPMRHDQPPPNFNNFHQTYENYPIDSYSQPRENQANLYKSFDNHEWGKASYSNAPIPQNHQNVSNQHPTFHGQTSRGLKHGFVQRRPVNKRPLNINEQSFNVSTSPKQARTEPRTMSKNIKEVPITETLPPAPLPPGKEILPPEDEDEETKELRLKLQEQKRIREENLRRKETRRRQMAAQRLKELQDQSAASTSSAVSDAPIPKKPPPVSTQIVPKKPVHVLPTLQGSPNTVVKKKVVVVRRTSQSGIQQVPNVTAVPKMVLVSNQNVPRGRGRGRAQPNQFWPRPMQNVMGGPRFPNPKLNAAPGVFARSPVRARGPVHVVRSPGNAIRNMAVRPTNPRIVQSAGNPQLKMLRMVSPVKVPPNRQVIAAGSPPKLDTSLVRRVQLPENETHASNRIVRPPQSQERSVLINNLSATTTENQLRQLTQGIGAVEMIKLLKDGRAYVTFKQAQHASQFQKKYQRHMLDLSMIQVSMVLPQVS